MDYTRTITQWLADLVFPARCVGCNAVDAHLCQNCILTIGSRPYQECIVCTKISLDGRTCASCQPQTSIDRLLVATPSDNPLVTRAIWNLKYRFVQALAEPLARWMADSLALGQLIQSSSYSYPLIISVPLHTRRLRDRGFNQSDLLAHRLASLINTPYSNEVLTRQRATASQVETHSRSERLDNMKDAFVCPRPELVDGHDIILIDDVCTTGATLNACAVALKHAGAASVTAAVLIRG